jgi:hypothetical protein
MAPTAQKARPQTLLRIMRACQSICTHSYDMYVLYVHYRALIFVAVSPHTHLSRFERVIA